MIQIFFSTYHKVFSPFFHALSLFFVGPGQGCRFYPTCGHYGEEAFEKHGICRGLYLTLIRLSRCHPWGKKGVDWVPENTKPQKR